MTTATQSPQVEKLKSRTNYAEGTQVKSPYDHQVYHVLTTENLGAVILIRQCESAIVRQIFNCKDDSPRISGGNINIHPGSQVFDDLYIFLRKYDNLTGGKQ